MSIKMIRPGLLTTIQDLGRYGYQKHGVIVGGAMDTFALRIGNLLVGNREQEAVLEMTMIGPMIEFVEDSLISITGGDLSPTLNGQVIPLWRPVWVKKGSVLQFGPCQSGCRSYLAIAGGFDIPFIMGSRSTYLRAGMGGFEGRALKGGDLMKVLGPTDLSRHMMQKLSANLKHNSFAAAGWCPSPEILPDYHPHRAIRVVQGLHFHHFTLETKKQFFHHAFDISLQSDRMGYRLSGPALQLLEPIECISAAVSVGTIQVPPDGKPILLLADRQTTGGYPIIAHAATVDLPLLAQKKPGESIRFQEVSLAEAQRLYLERERQIRQLKQGIILKMR